MSEGGGPGGFGELLRASARLAQHGISGMETALRGLSRALAGGPADPARPPLDGPPDADAAAADLGNRMIRLLRDAALSPAAALSDLPEEALWALAASLPRGARGNPARWPLLPVEAAVAAASLAAQAASRGLVVARSLPTRRLPDFLDFASELFGDLHVYFSLQYGEELERWQERARRNPEDGRARLELGRTYLKCGLFAEAARELEAAIGLGTRAAHSGLVRRARYEKTVALVRCGRYAEALSDGAACLAADPRDERARWWLYLAARGAGGYPPEVPAELQMEIRSGQGATDVRMEAVAAEIGLDKVSGGRGTAVFDADGDGYLDVISAGAHAGLSFFRNNGDGTFRDESTGSGLDRCVYAFALAAADYDNDGRTDLFVTGLGFFHGRGLLYRNDGLDGAGRVVFRDVTEEAGVATWGPGFHASWADFDGDGWLDLFVAHNAGGLLDRKTPNRLFRSNGRDAAGRITFTDVAGAAGLVTPWPTLGAAWGDFRNVGRLDLFLSNFGPAQLFRNQGDGTFRDVSREAGVDEPAIGSVAFACDFDDDGWLDVVQCTYSRPQEALHTLRHGTAPPGARPARLFRNNRDGTFTLLDREIGLDGAWGTMSANAGDFDNDGHLDLLLGNGDPQMDRTEPAVLLASDGSRFRDVTFTAGLPPTGKGHGVNFADLGGDGRLHLIVGSGGLYPGDLATTAVFRPRERPGNYLNVRLVGTACNRDAIGARLVLAAGGREQHRLVSGGSGFGCLPLEQHFGLGTLGKTDRLIVRWPGGGEQVIDKPPVNTTLRIVQGRAGWEPVYAKKQRRRR